MDTEPTASAPNERDLEKDATDLIQLMGQTLNMALLYGVNHKVTRSSLELTCTVIGKFMEFHDHIHFSIAEGALLINGAATTGSPLAGSFATRLTGLNLMSFCINPGFTLEECIALYNLLLTPAAKLNSGKSTAEMMEELGLQHIEAKSFSYRRIADDTPDGDTPPPPAAPQTPPPEMPVAAETAEPKPDLDNIMAFLKGDEQADPNRSAEDIRHLAADTEKLAELILRSVEIRTSMANLEGGESLSDLVVGCIQKVIQPIVKDPGSKTQKGRKQIKHSLLMLEKALLERLQTMAGDQAAHATEAMMEDLAEELDLDAIASKYMKNRRSSEKTQEKIARLVERAADDPAQLEELRERLTEQGLTPEGWQELTVNLDPKPEPNPAGSGGQGGGGGDGVNEIKVLTILLARIGETIQQPPGAAAAPEIQNLATETQQHLATLSEITDKKIDDLQALIMDEKKTPRLSRQQLLVILAEIAQELMQPLTIVSGTTAMLRTLRAGPVTDTQGELLGMITESSDRMTTLIQHLMHIAGTPKELNPDRAILNSAYKH